MSSVGAAWGPRYVIPSLSFTVRGPLLPQLSSPPYTEPTEKPRPKSRAGSQLPRLELEERELHHHHGFSSICILNIQHLHILLIIHGNACLCYTRPERTEIRLKDHLRTRLRLRLFLSF